MQEAYRLGLIAALQAGALLFYSPASAATCGDFFRFDPSARLSVSAISRLAEPTGFDVHTRNGVSIMFWPFDRENQPVKGKWAAFALIYASTGGLGEARPGGVLWAAHGLDLYDPTNTKLVKKSDGVHLTITQKEIAEHCPGGFKARIDNNNVLFVNGVRIGELK